MLGPDDYIKMDEKDKKGHADLAPVLAEKLEAVNEGLIPVRLVPIGVTKPHANVMHSKFPIMLRAEQVTKLGKSVRVLKTETTLPLDLKFPAKVKAEYPLETGLATLFEALGHKAPGFK
jgi:hypothetical protein